MLSVAFALGAFIVPLAALTLGWRVAGRGPPAFLSASRRCWSRGSARRGDRSGYRKGLSLTWTELSLSAAEAGASGAALAAFLLAAPLEEALKVGIVWPLFATRKLRGERRGLLYAGAAGLGLAATESASIAFLRPPPIESR